MNVYTQFGMMACRIQPRQCQNGFSLFYYNVPPMNFILFRTKHKNHERIHRYFGLLRVLRAFVREKYGTKHRINNEQRLGQELLRFFIFFWSLRRRQVHQQFLLNDPGVFTGLDSDDSLECDFHTLHFVIVDQREFICPGQEHQV